MIAPVVLGGGTLSRRGSSEWSPFGASFSPADLPGLALWLDASDESTITHDEGAVSQWDDKSGNGNHVSQGTASNQPTTGTRTINGRNVLSTDGGEFLISALLTVAQPATMVVVAQQDAAVSSWWGGSSAGLAMAMGAHGGYFAISAGSIFYSTAVPDTNAHVLSAVLNGAASVLRLENTEWVGNPGTRGFQQFGFPYNGSPRIEGRFAEALVYERALTAQERATVTSHLASKWGVTLA